MSDELRRPQDVYYALEQHPLEAKCHICGSATRQGVAVDFPTRARGAAAVSRADGQEPERDLEKRLRAVPMTVHFACHASCVESFWLLIQEEPLPRAIG